MKEYEKAGEIAQKVKKFAATLIKPGALLVEIAEDVEAKIEELGGRPAFPVDVSLNEIAAHYSPIYGDKSKLKDGDLVKVDIGVHIDGYVVDTAISFSVGESEENEKLIKAANEALQIAISMAKPGQDITEIGAAIQDKIADYGFQSIRNLRGHGVGRWIIHGEPFMPNYPDKNAGELQDGQIIAIEPFPTTGEGMVIDGKGSEVYQIVSEKNIRMGRDVLDWIKSEFHELPFCKRWIIKKFGPLKTSLVIRQLKQAGVIHEFALLREKQDGKVAQAEHTLIVKDPPVVFT